MNSCVIFEFCASCGFTCSCERQCRNPRGVLHLAPPGDACHDVVQPDEPSGLAWFQLLPHAPTWVLNLVLCRFIACGLVCTHDRAEALAACRGSSLLLSFCSHISLPSSLSSLLSSPFPSPLLPSSPPTATAHSPILSLSSSRCVNRPIAGPGCLIS